MTEHPTFGVVLSRSKHSGENTPEQTDDFNFKNF